MFRSALIAIDDWHCNGNDSAPGSEEWCGDDRIVITRRGAWELSIEGKSRLADPLHATLWNGGAAFRVRHPALGSDVCTVFRLTTEGTRAVRELRRRRGTRDPQRTFGHRTQRIEGRTYWLHRRLFEHVRRHGTGLDRLAVEESAFELVYALAAADAAPDTAIAHRSVDGARDLIAREFRSPLDVEGIARAVGCSPFHLSRLFRRSTGSTLYRSVLQLRLREALERVLDEPENLTRIALDTGFASHAHLSDAFRREYGCSPSEARRMAAY
jgi:AraC-like DNA-binding protein